MISQHDTVHVHRGSGQFKRDLFLQNTNDLGHNVDKIISHSLFILKLSAFRQRHYIILVLQEVFS
jgi:hypothetical protein